MRFVRFRQGGSSQWGIDTESGIVPFGALPVEDPDLETFTNPSYLETVSHAAEQSAAAAVSVDDVTVLAPVQRPGKIIGVGMNYRDHAEEQDVDIPEKPLLFGKASTAVTNPGDPIVCPDDVDDVDYEVELAVVMGRQATDVSAAEAEDYVAGYTIINDVSARDAQFDDKQWFRGKSYDTFAPMGPALVVDEGFDANAVDVEMTVNGTTKQESNTEQFVFDVPELVEYISNVMTLGPGDVIATGTPGGVGVFRDPPELLSPGDHVAASIEGIGTLENPVIAEP